MSRYYLLGGLLVIGGVLLVLWQAISSMMTAGEIAWKRIDILTTAGAKHFEWVESISLHAIQGAIQYILTMPLYILLIAFGALLFVIGGLVQK